MLRQRNYCEWSPEDEDSTSDSYDDMSDALEPFKDMIEQGKSLHGRPLSPSALQSSLRVILRALQKANQADLQEFIADVDGVLGEIEDLLDRIDKKEKKDPSIKKNKTWMTFADSVEKAFGALDDLLPKLRQAYRGTP